MGRNTNKHPVTRLTVDLTAWEKELLSRLQEKFGARSTAETVRRAAELCTDLLEALGAGGENQLFVGRDQGQLTRVVLTGLRRGV